jgi:hypothetical protein
MTKHILIDRALKSLNQLPEDKIKSVADFADFLLKRYEDEILSKGISKLVSDSKVYEFLENEEDLYSVNDLKERYK